ncbi:MAG: ATP-binding protein, partial [Candidatus Tectomicrobia bacterium]|nr:ATP-binding protein [Candidatus Tectomicrobia bacterium]
MGRDGVVEALDTYLQAACEGESQYVVLEGAAGSGKSALLTEFRLLQCHSAKFCVAQVNAGDCLVEAACMNRLLTALQIESEAILRRLYDDTKRIRRALAIDWDEAEFRTFLASADWAQIQDEPVLQPRGVPGRGDALTQLLHTVREHPWGVGAATILDNLSQQVLSAPDASAWSARWTALLGALQTRGVTPGSALVIMIDQLDAPTAFDAASAWRWEPFWRDFVAVSETVSLPLMILWSGTSDSLTPVRQALEHRSTAATYQLGALPEDAQQELVNRLQRALPREGREAWQQAVTAAGEPALPYPGHLMLAAASVAAWAERGGTGEALPQGLHAAEVSTWVERLIESSHRRQTVEESVFRQFLEAWAFLPAGKECTIEELLLLCHPETVDLDPVEGRTILEELLGQWVRYGLLQHNAFDSQYTAGDSLIQEAIRQWLYPDAALRRQVAVQRRVAVAVLTYVQQGNTAMLAALGEVLQEMAAEETGLSVTEHVIPSFRHMVWTLTKDERHQVATS